MIRPGSVSRLIGAHAKFEPLNPVRGLREAWAYIFGFYPVLVLRTITDLAKPECGNSLDLPLSSRNLLDVRNFDRIVLMASE